MHLFHFVLVTIKVGGFSSNSSQEKKTCFRKIVVTFVSSVCFSRSLYCWKFILDIYNFLVILFEKFLCCCIHIIGLRYDKLLTAWKNTITRS
jgi:hypothetical protein